MSTKRRFAHHNLEVYRLALEQIEDVHDVTLRFPRGYRHIADQMIRAACSTLGLIGEGAHRVTAPQKRQRFGEARGEAGEVAVHVETAHAIRSMTTQDAERVLSRADRICAMLSKLVEKFG